jgi:hypothetical protein
MSKTIHVKKEFKLNLSNDRLLLFVPGQHTVEDDVADHWFTRLHCEDGSPKFEKGEGPSAPAPILPGAVGLNQRPIDALDGADKAPVVRGGKFQKIDKTKAKA